MLNVYADFVENFMAVPVVKGVKTPNERFAGALDTYCIEAMLQDGKALQAPLGGTARVASVSPGDVRPVFNLDVARYRTFFVGRSDALVHDNAPPDPHQKPFDAGMP